MHIILGLAIFLFIIMIVIIPLGKAMNDYSKEGVCYKASTIKMLQNKIIGVAIRDSTYAPRLSTSLSRYCEIQEYTIGSNVKEETIKKTIADQIASCWRQYYRGTINIFENEPGKSLYCIPCSFITF
jgi:hypothetical protein